MVAGSVAITLSALSAPLNVSHVAPCIWIHAASSGVHQPIASQLLDIPLLPQLYMQNSGSTLCIKSKRQKW